MNDKKLVKTPPQAITLKYIYSACVVTTTPDLKLLHDPWFTEGIYDGSWYQFPKVADPIVLIGDVDMIYVSHIHPDHYDPIFLHRYFEKYGKKEILIGNHKPNHLAGKMKADGFSPKIVAEPFQVSDTTIEIIPHDTGSISDIDSALIFKFTGKDRTHCLVNTNDINFDDKMRHLVKERAGDIDILLCGYAGAGPYPQTYYDVGNPYLKSEGEKKRDLFFERYQTLIEAMAAKVNIPFAGKYLLGGKLAPLNIWRGVPDAAEVLALDKKAIILGDDGGEIDTAAFKPTKIRTQKYSDDVLTKRLQEIGKKNLDYECFIAESVVPKLPLKRLLGIASRNALAKSECDEDYFFCIELPSAEFAVINANKNAGQALSFQKQKSELPFPRSEIYIDPRYLFGLLTHIHHWNNADVGSLFNVRRFPDFFIGAPSNTYNKKVQWFLNFLTV